MQVQKTFMKVRFKTFIQVQKTFMQAQKTLFLSICFPMPRMYDIYVLQIGGVYILIMPCIYHAYVDVQTEERSL